MNRRIVLRPEALEQIREAAAWYTTWGRQLGTGFREEVSAKLEAIRKAPLRFPAVDGEIRKAVLRRFPYILLFRARKEEILVLSCFHTRRDPKDRPGGAAERDPP